jgi:hypothetical protein
MKKALLPPEGQTTSPSGRGASERQGFGEGWRKRRSKNGVGVERGTPAVVVKSRLKKSQAKEADEPPQKREVTTPRNHRCLLGHPDFPPPSISLCRLSSYCEYENQDSNQLQLESSKRKAFKNKGAALVPHRSMTYMSDTSMDPFVCITAGRPFLGLLPLASSRGHLFEQHPSLTNLSLSLSLSHFYFYFYFFYFFRGLVYDCNRIMSYENILHRYRNRYSEYGSSRATYEIYSPESRYRKQNQK